MIRSIGPILWAYDLEWAPDPQAGRRLYGLSDAVSDVDVVGEMWRLGGATEENPTPFLKMILCRVLSIAVVQRTVGRDGRTDLKLLWLPRDETDPAQCSEAALLKTFLDAIGKHKPQLVGYNSSGSDFRILIQRGVVNGIMAGEFCAKPDRPQGADYFHRYGDHHLDLMELLAGWGRFDRHPSLHEVAVLSGIPGKFETEGEQVAQMWLSGRLRKIIEYNCFDALSTYLLWLRMVYFSGLLQSGQYEEEQGLLKDLLLEMSEKPETAFLERYLEEWDRLQGLSGL